MPGPCKDLLRDLGNEAAHAAATGDHDSIKALIMFARVVMFVPIKTRSKPTTIIRGRLLRWQKGEFAGLHDELKEYEDEEKK